MIDDVQYLIDGSPKPVSIELDHFFILVSTGGSEAAAHLVSCGLREGASNTHPGQGTACRRFFFENAYLELLWCEDATEAQSESTRRTHLWDRWVRRETGACPFGFIFRPSSRSPTAGPPFSCWDYRPTWLPADMSIAVGDNAHRLLEPMLFYILASRRPDRAPAEKYQPLVHATNRHKMSRVQCVLPSTLSPSAELQSIVDHGPIHFRAGKEHWLEIGFDQESKNCATDFRPDLPLVLRW